jgi:FkbM family methyltransferase
MIRTIRYIWTHPLASRSRFAALSNYVRWQVGSRILRGPCIMPFVDKAKLVVERGMHGATGNVYCGLHEFNDMAFLLHYLCPDDCFVDVGANIGSYTVLASAVVGARTICLEPVPASYEQLMRNVHVNNLEDRVVCHCCAAGRERGTSSFTLDKGTTNGFTNGVYAGESASVQVERLDDLLAGRATSLWKVDVEGAEAEVLGGATESLRHPALQALIVETNDAEVRSLLNTSGFRLATYDPFNRRLHELSESEPIAGNGLWIRNAKAVANRCLTGRSCIVLGISI